MKVPKIIFKEMTLKENIEIIKWAYFENDGLSSVHDYTINYFPQLAKINSSLSKLEIYIIIEEIVSNDYNKYQDKIKNEVNRYNSLWEHYNDKYFTTLTSYLNINWPANVNEIIATVGLIPIFPRYLDNFSFSIGTGVDDLKLIEVSAHETLHFLWFEKWKKMHPEIPRTKYESPYLAWQYSEMVTDPILNNKPFSEIFKFTEKGYDSFYELEYNGHKVMDELKNIYSQNITIEEKINNGYKYLKNTLNQNKKLKKQ